MGLCQCSRGNPFPSPPVAHTPLATAAAAAAAPLPRSPSAAAGHSAGLGPLPARRPPQATARVLGPSPRSGGRPADLDPTVTATASAAASGSRLYPLLQSVASGSPHPAASMSEPRRQRGGGSMPGPLRAHEAIVAPPPAALRGDARCVRCQVVVPFLI